MTVLLFGPIASVADFLGTITLSSTLNDFIDSLFICIIVSTSVVVAYNLYYQRKKFIQLINSLNEIVCVQINKEHSAQIIIECSKAVTFIIWFLVIVGSLSVTFYSCLPFWYSIKNMILENTGEYPLIFNTWYPYDRTKFPYYQMSTLLEITRAFCTTCIILGNDCLFILISLYIFELYYILATKFENLIKLACEHNTNSLILAHKSNEVPTILFKENLHKLQRESIEEHIALNK